MALSDQPFPKGLIQVDLDIDFWRSFSSLEISNRGRKFLLRSIGTLKQVFDLPKVFQKIFPSSASILLISAGQCSLYPKYVGGVYVQLVWLPLGSLLNLHDLE